MNRRQTATMAPAGGIVLFPTFGRLIVPFCFTPCAAMN
ncbi:hypothetical protein HMPREF1502_4214 [Klebsiella sp. AS10]|nr:hypothetical protein HMPREF1502_4214 [Klebsiella sp. AS10]